MPETMINFSKPVSTLDSNDALSQILNSIGISGSLLLKEEYCSPWAVSVPESRQLNTLLKTPEDSRVATFHLVEHGHIHLKLESGEDFMIEAGEIVVCFSGQGHTLYQGESQSIIPFHDIMAGTENIFKPIHNKDNNKNNSYTSLVYGVFLLYDTALNPLLAALPDVLKLSVTNPKDYPRLYGLINLMVLEFNHPEVNWSVKKLAAEIALSPSRFAARFVKAVGEPPMIYVTKWRMYVASRELKSKRSSIEQIAHDVGYESMASL